MNSSRANPIVNSVADRSTIMVVAHASDGYGGGHGYDGDAKSTLRLPMRSICLPLRYLDCKIVGHTISRSIPVRQGEQLLQHKISRRLIA